MCNFTCASLCTSYEIKNIIEKNFQKHAMHNVGSADVILAQFLQNELVMYVSINKQYVKIPKLLWHAILALPRNGLKNSVLSFRMSPRQNNIVLLAVSYGWSGPAQVSPLNRVRRLQGDGENYTSRSEPITGYSYTNLFTGRSH
jgi:hypothetical protein